ncbi:MAG TPA: hypothetical protein VLF93_05575 [Candidatus Saccharimonadales bacterium]|nr:hypothetical protein [Candidatus Saccharimonadales bacterium]
MDPTKSFDHLDPKLKETYARVMGTTTNDNSNNTNQNAGTPPPTDPALSASPQTTFDPGTDPNQLGPSPLGPTMNQADTGPNPGTGPTINSMQTDTSSLLSTSAPDMATAPSNASFFSNPSPVTTDPSQQAAPSPFEQPSDPTPITPYSPEGLSVPQANPSPEQFAQPLPSPAAVNQSAQHETSPLLRVLYIVGAVIFFAVYTVFWMVIFHLPLPFSLSF